MIRVRLLDLDRGVEVEVEVGRDAHPAKIVDKLRAAGLVSQREAVVFGVSPNRRQVFYVPAATVEQLVTYVNQTRQILCFRRFPIHQYKPS